MDPDGDEYSFNDGRMGGFEFNESRDMITLTDFNHSVFIINNAKCDGDRIAYSDSTNEFSIAYKLEGGGTYCLSGTGLNINTYNGGSGEPGGHIDL